MAGAYLRLIAFPVEPAYGIAQTWWEQLIGTAADNIADQKQKRTREEFGTTAGANLVLSIDPAGVQWTAAHIEETNAPVPGLPVIGPFVERQGLVRSSDAKVARVLSACQSVGVYCRPKPAG